MELLVYIILPLFAVLAVYIFIGLGIVRTHMFMYRRSWDETDMFVIAFWPCFLFGVLPIYGIFKVSSKVWDKAFAPFEKAREILDDKREQERLAKLADARKQRGW